MTVEVKADPAMPPNKHTAFAPSSGFAIGSAVHPPLCAAACCGGATCAQRSSLRAGCVVPPFITWRPHPPMWRSPSHFPAAPVIDTVLDIQRVILSDLHTFRTFTAVLSRIAVFNTPGDPMRALLSYFRTGSGHRIVRTPLASPTPRKSAPRGNPFRRFIRSLSLRPSWLYAP